MKPSAIESLNSTRSDFVDVVVDVAVHVAVDVAVNVSSDSLSVFCKPLMNRFETHPWQIDNRSDAIRDLLEMLAARTESRGLGRLRVGSVASRERSRESIGGKPGGESSFSTKKEKGQKRKKGKSPDGNDGKR